MTQAREIHKLIEEADPSDTEKLTEIDIRTHVFITQDGYVNEMFFKGKGMPINGSSNKSIVVPQYTRSRDALKQVRPKCWAFIIRCYVPEGEVHCACYGVSMMRGIEIDRGTVPETKELILPTEELAELWAIIQAIEYERSQP